MLFIQYCPCVLARSNVPNDPDVFFILVTGNTGDTNADGTFAIRKLANNDPSCPAGSRGVVIYLAVRNLDYETITQYKLILQVVYVLLAAAVITGSFVGSEPTRIIKHESRLHPQNTQNARVDEQVLVAIEDVNDIPPLLQPFDGAITENSPPILITTIKAIDKDASPQFRNLVYSFDEADVNPDVKTKFSLSPNGQLRTLMPLDREDKNKYMIPVHVTDGVEPCVLWGPKGLQAHGFESCPRSVCRLGFLTRGNGVLADHNRTSMYWITVQDINDVPPQFDENLGVYEVEVPEDKAVGKNTGIVLKVIDPDVGEFTYCMLSLFSYSFIDPCVIELRLISRIRSCGEFSVLCM
ncbi:DE-cadherin [Portunus trituberculatus]|uniref:DE-cadherin n=1 Tax=Portunus trituberculatus TaxID=210409 RepID=A0A5B7G2L2_PORTR|nr:DE-cadherin [Portunus trituberculatus]